MRVDLCTTLSCCFNCFILSCSLAYPISSIYHVKGVNAISPSKPKSFFLMQTDGFQLLFRRRKKKRKLLFWPVAMLKLKTCLLVKVEHPNEWLAFERTRDNPCSHSVQALMEKYRRKKRQLPMCTAVNITLSIGDFSFSKSGL